MAVNKVTYGGETLIDLTSDTVTADKLAQGITAHDKSGAAIVGTLVASAKKLAVGAFSQFGSSSVRSKTITHGLGETPNFAAVFTLSYQNSNSPVIIMWQNNKNTAENVYQYWENVNTSIANGSDYMTVTMNATQVVFNGGVVKFYGQYRYIIGVI